MKRATLALAIATLTLTAGCGGGSDSEPAAQGATATQPDASTAQSESVSPSPSPTATAAPEPAYSVLSKDDLTAALLTIQDLPVGYSQDPPSAAGTKTFCDYEAPKEKVYVSHDFTKGGGLSGQILRTGLRQYETADQAQTAFDALTTALATCQSETYEGTKLVYAAMSAPKVGDESVGVRIDAEGTILLQNFALVGPTVVSTGGGGLIEADADEVAALLETQVKNYQAAAEQ